MDASMTPDELQGLLAQVIAGVAGGTERVWRGKVGPVAKLPIALHPRSNWAVSPLCGTDDHRVSAGPSRWSGRSTPTSRERRRHGRRVVGAVTISRSAAAASGVGVRWPVTRQVVGP